MLEHNVTFPNVMIWCNIWNAMALCNLTKQSIPNTHDKTQYYLGYLEM